MINLRSHFVESLKVFVAGKELYSPDNDNPPAPPCDSVKQTSRANSFEIENLLKVHSIQLICFILLFELQFIVCYGQHHFIQTVHSVT